MSARRIVPAEATKEQITATGLRIGAVMTIYRAAIAAAPAISADEFAALKKAIDVATYGEESEAMCEDIARAVLAHFGATIEAPR